MNTVVSTGSKSEAIREGAVFASPLRITAVPIASARTIVRHPGAPPSRAPGFSGA
jgi:hypothetical protein